MAKLTEARLKPAEFQRVVWSATPDAGTTVEDILEPAFWLHNARKLRPDSIIQAMPDDRAWFAELLVLSVNAGGAKVALLRKVELQDAEEESLAIDGYIVKWGGSVHKWRVMRAADKTVMQAGFTEKGDAYRWLADNVEKKAA